FMEQTAGFGDLLYAPGRRANSSRHDKCFCPVGTRDQARSEIRSATSLGHCNMARGRHDLHARAGRIAGSASVLSFIACMGKLWIVLLYAGFSLLDSTVSAQGGQNVEVHSGIDHYDYDRLLKKYVNEQGLVNYSAWKQNTADIAALDEYLKQFAAKIDNPAQGNEKAASLVNAYNAFVLRRILSNYPAESIWQLKDSFSARRNEIGSREVSLDDLERGTLQPLIGYRAHAVLVCAARSCPPLQRFSYTADRFDEQNDAAYRSWLAREDLNKFLPYEKKVEISSIFKWFKQDFDKAGGVPKILGRYAPASAREFAASENYAIKYLPYNWGLNDQGPHGRSYSRAQFLLDNIFK